MRTYWNAYNTKPLSCANILDPSSSFVYLMPVMRVSISRKSFIFPPRVSPHTLKNNNLCCCFAFKCRAVPYTLYLILYPVSHYHTQRIYACTKSQLFAVVPTTTTHMEKRFTSQLHRVILESIIIERHIYCINGALVRLYSMGVYIGIFSIMEINNNNSIGAPWFWTLKMTILCTWCCTYLINNTRNEAAEREGVCYHRRTENNI